MTSHLSKKLYSVLVIDDAVENLRLITGILESSYRVIVAKSGDRGVELAKVQQPDLILLDILMPAPDGFETCSDLKTSPLTRDIPVIFLTALNDIKDEARGLSLGAVDYIHKPISPPILLSRVTTHIALKNSIDKLHCQNDDLEKEVSRRTKDLVTIQDVTIYLAAALAETRDNETGNHILRTQHYIKILAEKVMDHPCFRDQLNRTVIQQLYRSAPLHDIGKIGIEDKILCKPGKLDEAEFEIMKTHAMIGWRSIQQAEETLGSQVEFLVIAKEICRHHHEKWDGSGYPDGLVGNAIPLSARLMAIADVYDALTTRRVYKEAFDHNYAMRFIAEKAGIHFDPDLSHAFITIQDKVETISKRYSD